MKKKSHVHEAPLQLFWGKVSMAVRGRNE